MVTSLDLKAAFIFSVVMSSHVELKMSMFYELKSAAGDSVLFLGRQVGDCLLSAVAMCHVHI